MREIAKSFSAGSSGAAGIGANRITWRDRLPVIAGCALIALAVNYLLGKELAWDLFNYHFYAGFSALHDRFGQDYFAAGPQSYFNPYAYVPFYLLVKSGLSALAVSSLLSVAHAMILWLTFELGIRVSPSDDRRTKIAIGICAAAFALLNPILLQQIGSSFVDITTAELVLGGWLLLADAVRVPRCARVIYAGALLGAAAALKLTNSAHAIAALAMLVMLPLTLKGRARHAIAYGASLAASFLLVAGPWSYRLYRMFGNPFFPLMNQVFRSPEFATEPLRHFRFLPETFGAALWRPFAIVDPIPMVHEEIRAPDLRYAVLCAMLIVLLARWLWTRRARRKAAPVPEERTGSTRVLAALACGFAVDWIIWLASSGNGRYFLPMACIAAVLIVGGLFRILAARPKARNYILAGIVGVQIVQLALCTDLRWTAAPWGGPWFSIEVPERLRTEPSLYLTEGSPSNSFLAPYLAMGSGLVNFSGGYALGPGGATGARLEALMNHYRPHLRVLVRGERIQEDADEDQPQRAQVDAPLERFGLQVDTSDCATITVSGVRTGISMHKEGAKRADDDSRSVAHLVSCRVIGNDADRSAEIARERDVDLVLDRVEDACPQLFQPRRMLTEHSGGTWSRSYSNTDLIAWVSGGMVKFYQVNGGEYRSVLGSERDWAKAPLRLACGRRGGIYFAKVLDAEGTR